MYTHLHRRVSTILQSAQKSKQYPFHNACKRIAHEFLINFISHNLSWTTRLRLSALSHITNHSINNVHTSALQRLEDTAIITKIEAILISQCMQTYCTRTPFNLTTLDITHNLSWTTRLCLSTLSHITNHIINYVHTSALQHLNDTDCGIRILKI